MQDLVDLNLRVPLEKEIPVTVVPEEKEDAKSADGEEEFPEITEVSLLRSNVRKQTPVCVKALNLEIRTQRQIAVPFCRARLGASLSFEEAKNEPGFESSLCDGNSRNSPFPRCLCPPCRKWRRK